MTRDRLSWLVRCAASVALLWAVSGCSNGGSADSGPPTWNKDVAPIAMQYCVGCHDGSGIAPFSLLSYDSARLQATRIRIDVDTRKMPPFAANNSGSCNTFRDARWLSDAQIATIDAWVEGGALEGDPADAPPPPPPVDNLADKTTTVNVGTFEPDPTLSDDYRCFVVDPGNTTDMYLTGYQVVPGNARMVHHAILYSIDDDAGEAQADALLAEDDKPGYACFGDSRIDNSRFIGGWAPGTPATRYPEGTGVKLNAGHRAIFQIHYNLANGPGIDSGTHMDLKLVPTVAHEGIVAPIADLAMVLQPRQSYEEVSTVEHPSLPVPVKVWGVFPHMHTLGRTLKVEDLAADGSSACMLDVERWDFNWQRFYWYDTPLRFPMSDGLRLTCGYDTTSRSDVVTWGNGTSDEMCLNFFYVTL